MRILVVGATGRIGSAVCDALSAHDVIRASRHGGDIRVDITDPASIDAMYTAVGPIDAVASTAGNVPYKNITEITLDDFRAGVADKLLGQVELVRRGQSTVTAGGSFTLITGILAREPIRTGTVGSLVNGALESFVRAAAVELPRRQRINAVSPTVLTEALDVYSSFFPGFLPVPAADVASIYRKSIEGPYTGRIFALG